jgi:antitoxin CptB
MSETPEHRIKRLRMRSMRRGIKEMDIILMRYAEQRLETLEDAQLEVYDAFLSENDQDLYQWVTGQVPAPEPFAATVRDIVLVTEPAK